MGKKFITIALILIGLNSFSQENKKWIPSVRAGVGTWLDITFLVHTTIGALVMPLMAQGFKMGVIKFVLITGTKQQGPTGTSTCKK